MLQNKKNLHICQHRYLSGGKALPEEDYLWHAPLGLAFKKENEKPVLFNEIMSTRERTVELPHDTEFYKLNYGQTGFYRVQYPQEAIDAIGAAVENHEFGAGDRLGIIADSFAISADGYQSAVIPLQLLAKYSNETDYL